MPKKKLKILPKIFSVNNTKDRRHKITTILGLKIKIKRKFNIKNLEKEIKSHYKNTDIPKILIVSHEFSHTGAPKVALLLTNTLKDIYKTFQTYTKEYIFFSEGHGNVSKIEHIKEKFQLILEN